MTVECEVDTDAFISSILSVPALHIDGEKATTARRYELAEAISRGLSVKATPRFINGKMAAMLIITPRYEEKWTEDERLFAGEIWTKC